MDNNKDQPGFIVHIRRTRCIHSSGHRIVIIAASLEICRSIPRGDPRTYGVLRGSVSTLARGLAPDAVVVKSTQRQISESLLNSFCPLSIICEASHPRLDLPELGAVSCLPVGRAGPGPATWTVGPRTLCVTDGIIYTEH